MGEPRGATLVVALCAWLAAGAAAEQRKIEEIVVTARKRAELLEDTPLSVTALDESALREAGVTRLDEIQSLVPNLQFLSGRGDQEASIVIRGIRGEGEIAFDPGVGIYVDGVYLSRTQGAIIDIVDIEQVEVLRGPQGTLFGKNTVGGAINVTSVKPKNEVSGFASLRAGSFDTVETRATLNAPLVSERLLARLSFGSSNRGGYTKNLLRDENWSNRNSLAFIGTLRWIATDELTVDLTGTWSRNHARPRGGQCAVQNPNPPLHVAGYLDACRRSRPFDFEADSAGLWDVASYGAWANLEWETPHPDWLDSLTLKSTSSWREQTPRSRDDIDMTALPITQLAGVGGGKYDGEPGFARQFSEDLQATGAAFDGRLTMVAGAFTFFEKANDTFTTHITLPGTPIDVGVESLTEVDNWDWALYGQATAELTDWLDLTAGIRFTQEKKGLARTNQDLDSTEPAPRATGRATFDAWTPMASIALRLPDPLLERAKLDHLMSYFTYSRGFRGGGFNGTLGSLSAETLVPFEPEFLDSFEIGTKLIAFDRRLFANVALFLAEYQDIQKSTIVSGPDGDGDGVPDTVEVFVQNAARATVQGVEAEVTASPIGKLWIRGSIGYLDARFDDFDSFSRITGEPLDRSGETFRQAPDLQSNLVVQYPFELNPPGPAWLAGTLTPRLDWYYQSRIHFQEPELTTLIQGGYHLLHGRIGYVFQDGSTEIALWGKNLTDESYIDWGIPPLAEDFGTTVRYYASPRVLGVELSHWF